MRRSKRKTFLFVSTIWMASWLPSVAIAQDTQSGEVLKSIIDTAAQICQSAPLEGSASGLTLSGEAKGQVGVILRKLTDLGISGSAGYQSEHSVGVLQKDLVEAIQSSNNCKLEVFKTLERDLLSGRGISQQNASQAPSNSASPVQQSGSAPLHTDIQNATTPPASKTSVSTQEDSPDTLERNVNNYVASKLAVPLSRNGMHGIQVRFVEPPSILPEEGVAECTLHASIVSDRQTLVFQDKFEGWANAGDTEGAIAIAACRAAADQMVKRFDTQ